MTSFRALPPIAIAVALLALSVRPLYADDSWQTSWEAFVESFNNCVQREGCDTKQFVGKTVTWAAAIESITEKDGLMIGMDMKSSPPLKDKTGVASDVIALALRPEPAQQPLWRQTSKGQKVLFRCKTSEPFNGMNSPVGFVSAGPGRNIALVSTEGGELIEVLANQ